MHSRLFSDKEFNQKLIRIALPLTLQSFMLAAVAASDTFMLGVVEQNAMSAVSLASKIQFIQNIVVCSVSAVISMLGAQYWGKKSKHTCGKVLGIGLHISTLVSFLFFAGCLFIPRTLMSVFTNSAELIDIGEKYLKIAGWSYLLTGPTQCLLSLLKVTGNERSSVAGVKRDAGNGCRGFGIVGDRELHQSADVPEGHFGSGTISHILSFSDHDVILGYVPFRVIAGLSR